MILEQMCQLAWLSLLTQKFQTYSALPYSAFTNRAWTLTQGSLAQRALYPGSGLHSPFLKISKKATACRFALFWFSLVSYGSWICRVIFFPSEIESIWEVWCTRECQFFGFIFYSGPTLWRGQKGFGRCHPSSTKQHFKETASKWHRRWVWQKHSRKSPQERSASCFLPWYFEIKRGRVLVLKWTLKSSLLSKIHKEMYTPAYFLQYILQGFYNEKENTWMEFIFPEFVLTWSILALYLLDKIFFFSIIC